MSPQFIPRAWKLMSFLEKTVHSHRRRKKLTLFHYHKTTNILYKQDLISTRKSRGIFTTKIQRDSEDSAVTCKLFLVQTRHLQVTSTKTHKGKLAKHSPKWKVNNVTTYCIGGRQLCTQAKQTRELVKVDLDTIFTSPTTCVTPSDSLLTVLTPWLAAVQPATRATNK